MICRLRIRKPALRNKRWGVDRCGEVESGRVPGCSPTGLVQFLGERCHGRIDRRCYVFGLYVIGFRNLARRLKAVMDCRGARSILRCWDSDRCNGEGIRRILLGSGMLIIVSITIWPLYPESSDSAAHSCAPSCQWRCKRAHSESKPR